MPLFGNTVSRKDPSEWVINRNTTKIWNLGDEAAQRTALMAMLLCRPKLAAAVVAQLRKKDLARPHPLHDMSQSHICCVMWSSGVSLVAMRHAA